jgi:hypothetical protein
MGLQRLRINHGTREQRELARDVIRWFVANHVNTGRAITLNLTLSKNIKEYGMAVWNSRSSYNARSYSITVRSSIVSRNLFISTLLHELVHVQQMVTRSLRYSLRTDDYAIYWKGNLSAGLDYMDQPWEDEAYEREVILTKEYLAYARRK